MTLFVPPAKRYLTRLMCYVRNVSTVITKAYKSASLIIHKNTHLK